MISKHNFDKYYCKVYNIDKYNEESILKETFIVRIKFNQKIKSFVKRPLNDNLL